MSQSGTRPAETGRIHAPPGSDERGSALLIAMVLAVLVGGLVAAALPLALTESSAAAHARDAVAWRTSAEGALEVALRALEDTATWDPVLAGTVQGPVFETAGLNVAALEAEITREWGARLDRGADNPRWSLFAVGPSTLWLGPTPAGVPTASLAVWVADDGADGDGDQGRDSNGRVMVHAEAIGVVGGRASLTALVERVGSSPGPLRRLAWWPI